MQVEPLEVYAKDSNYAVIKPPGRNYPGSVIQGDSLRNLCWLATDLARHVRDRHSEDVTLLCRAEELVEELVGRLRHYKDVLRQHGIEFPFSIPGTELDSPRAVPEGES